MQPRIFYFGCWSTDRLGHFLYGPGGSSASSWADAHLPFQTHILDAGLIPFHRSAAKEQDGRVYRSVINGWTVLSFWDQSADGRPASNSAIVVEGDRPVGEVVRLAAHAFPEVFARPGFPIAA